MAWDITDYGKFKIGDLVKVVEKVDFAIDGLSIKAGEVGLIVAADLSEIDLISFWGIDYIVLIRGLRLLFFDSELELVKQKLDKPGDNINFIFLKN